MRWFINKLQCKYCIYIRLCTILTQTAYRLSDLFLICVQVNFLSYLTYIIRCNQFSACNQTFAQPALGGFTIQASKFGYQQLKLLQRPSCQLIDALLLCIVLPSDLSKFSIIRCTPCMHIVNSLCIPRLQQLKQPM